jgi:hypothetical protein
MASDAGHIGSKEKERFMTAAQKMQAMREAAMQWEANSKKAKTQKKKDQTPRAKFSKQSASNAVAQYVKKPTT